MFPEFPGEGKFDGENMVGELNCSMSGTRDAEHSWGEECACKEFDG